MASLIVTAWMFIYYIILYIIFITDGVFLIILRARLIITKTSLYEKPSMKNPCSHPEHPVFRV